MSEPERSRSSLSCSARKIQGKAAPQIRQLVFGFRGNGKRTNHETGLVSERAIRHNMLGLYFATAPCRIQSPTC